MACRILLLKLLLQLDKEVAVKKIMSETNNVIENGAVRKVSTCKINNSSL